MSVDQCYTRRPSCHTLTAEELERRSIIQRNDLLLHEAVIKNDTEAVRKILKDPVDINCRNNYGRAPLHWASSRGNLEIMEMIIAANADIEAKDKYGMKPLLMAAWHGHRDAVQLLINAGACTNSTNKKLYTLLICAAKNNRVEVIDFLLENLENIYIDAVDADNQTALFHASIEGHIAVVQRLVECGAGVDLKNKIATYHLGKGCKKEHFGLLEHTTKVALFSNRALQDRLNSSEERKKCWKKPDSSIFRRQDGKTALHLVCERGHVDVAEYLLAYDVELEGKDLCGNTPLHIAAQNQQTKIARLLVEVGADANAENLQQNTPLHLASTLGAQGIIEALLQYGASINKKNKAGNTALHLSSHANKLEATDYLVNKGADLNSLNERLQSPMHIAAEMGYSDICKLLLAEGANIEQREHCGRTPLYIAARGSFTAIVDMIIKSARLDYPEPEDNIGLNALPNESKAVFASSRRKFQYREHNKLNDNERLREILYKLAYKQLGPGEWKRLAQHWAFTEEQIRAIEHQYTGPSSFKEHGFRLALIWTHGLPPEVNPVKELYHSLIAIEKKNVADALRKKIDQENDDRRRGKRKICRSCSIN